MNRPVVIALIGLAVVAVATVLAIRHEREDVPAAPLAPAATLAPTPPAAMAVIDPMAPTFDVVRIDTEGDSVIAGRARPGAQVTILDGTAALGQVTADPRGEWVFVPPGPLAPGARELRLRALNPDGAVVDAAEPVILVVPERGKGPPLAFRVGRGGATVFQGPGGGPAPGGVSIDLVDHDDRGRLVVSGRAPSGGRLHVFLGDRPLGLASAEPDGSWWLAVTEPEARAGQLRAGLETAAGAQAAVAWSIQGAPVAQAPGAVVVESSPSVWRVGRRVSGEAAACTLIFAARPRPAEAALARPHP